MSRSSLTALILGGGKGTRLRPLTELRSKPAVPLAGKYRLIDIPISNCLNSGIEQIYLLTQFNSVSLHRHIRETYKFDRFGGGFVEILAAQQAQIDAESDWYQGTADAVRKNLRYVEQHGVEHVFILSGDQLYRMDYGEMLRTHRESGAAVTIGTLPVDREAAKGFGIMTLDDAGRITKFTEKPQTDAQIDAVATDPAWMDARGVESRGRDCLASMGIYLFDRDVLVDLLKRTDAEDFGGEVIPARSRTCTCRPTCSTGIGKTSGRSAASTRRIWSSPGRTRRSSSLTPPPRSTPAPDTCPAAGSPGRRSPIRW